MAFDSIGLGQDAAEINATKFNSRSIRRLPAAGKIAIRLSCIDVAVICGLRSHTPTLLPRVIGMQSTNTQWDVFISHNKRQKPWVRRVVDQWRSLGLTVFFDEDSIQPGEDVVTAIEKGISNSRHIVLVLTPSALASDWVAMEIATTITNDPAARDRRLLPVLLEATDNIRPLIKRLNMIDLTDEGTREDRYQFLLNSLKVNSLPLPSVPTLDVPPPARIELTLDADFDSFSDEQQRSFLRGVKELLGISGELKLIDRRKGSVILTLAASREDVDRIAAAAKSGRLADYNVVGAKVEEPLISQLRGGDAKALDEAGLLLHIQSVVYGRMRGLGDYESREQCFLMVITKLYKLISAGKLPDRIFTRGDLLRLCLQNFVTEYMRMMRAQRNNSFNQRLDAVAAHERDVLSDNVRRAVETVIAECPDGLSGRILKYRLEDYTNEEIAVMLNVSVRSVDSKLQRILKRLRELLTVPE